MLPLSAFQPRGKRVQARRKSAHFAQKPFKLKQFSAVTVGGTCRHCLTDSLGGAGSTAITAAEGRPVATVKPAGVVLPAEIPRLLADT